MISVALPSRGRPETLLRAVRSLAHGDVEIVVGLDLDDPTREEAERALEPFKQVRVVTSTRKSTCAQLFNYLADQTLGDAVIPFPDDYTVDQENWAELAEDTLAHLPNGLGVGYLWDPLYPHFATFPILPRRLIDMQGFFLPPFFPFLYGDTWWNEVGVMSGMILPSKASVAVQRETGAIHNYRDLKLWIRMFKATRCMREDLAAQMILSALGETQEAYYLAGTIKDRSQLCQNLQAKYETDAWIEKWEKYGDGFPHPHYSDLKAKAERFLEHIECQGNS